MQPPSVYFYRYRDQFPRLHAQFWCLSIGGLVKQPVALTYTQLQSRSLQTHDYALLSAHDLQGQPLLESGHWRGVPVRDLLAEVGVQPGAAFVRIEAADGYQTVLPAQRLEHALLALAWAGAGEPAPLAAEAGFPARLIVPGQYAYKSPRWVNRLEFVAAPTGGFWEPRGWPLDAPAQVLSAIVHPRAGDAVQGTVTLRGFAYAGERAVAAVFASVNRGAWMPIPFEQTSPYALAHWAIDWTPTAAGVHTLRVLAVDDLGQAQSEDAYAHTDAGQSLRPHSIHTITFRVY